MFNIYKPNNQGTGCSLSITYRGGSFGASLLKQAKVGGEKKGTFAPNSKNPEKNIFIKISLQEAAGIIDCIETNRIVKLFHDNQKKQASIGIEFSPYFKKENENKVGPQLGYTFKVNQTPKNGSSAPKTAFLIGLNFAEARLLKQALIFGLNKAFSEECAKLKKLDNNTAISDNTVNATTDDSGPSL